MDAIAGPATVLPLFDLAFNTELPNADFTISAWAFVFSSTLVDGNCFFFRTRILRVFFFSVGDGGSSLALGPREATDVLRVLVD